MTVRRSCSSKQGLKQAFGQSSTKGYSQCRYRTKTSRNPRGCNVITSSEARDIDVPRFLPIPLRKRAIQRPSLEKVKTAEANAGRGDLPRAPFREGAPGRPPTANTLPKGTSVRQTDRYRIAKSCNKQTLKPHASNQAGAATLGAGGCNSPLRPNRTSRPIAKD